MKDFLIKLFSLFKTKQEYIDNNLDIPDTNDYIFEDLFWATETPDLKSFPKEELMVQNQKLFSDTQMACWCFWLTHISNAQNILEFWKIWKSYNQVVARDLWLEYIKENPKARYEWSTLQTWLNRFKNMWLIIWYTKINSIEDAKKAIDLWQYIYSWALNWDWNSVKNTWIYKTSKTKTYGHLFTAWVWYNDVWFIAINSYWPKNWYFIIPYEEWNNLYSKYAIVDNENEEVIKTYKDLVKQISSMDLQGYTDLYFSYRNKLWDQHNLTKFIQSIWKKKWLNK